MTKNTLFVFFFQYVYSMAQQDLYATPELHISSLSVSDNSMKTFLFVWNFVLLLSRLWLRYPPPRRIFRTLIFSILFGTFGIEKKVSPHSCNYHYYYYCIYLWKRIHF